MATLFLLLYCGLYILIDIYMILSKPTTSKFNIKIKIFINKLLPFFTKFNKPFWCITLFLATIHMNEYSDSVSILNTGYLVYFLLLICGLFTFFKKVYNLFGNFIFNPIYILLITLLVHVFIN